MKRPYIIAVLTAALLVSASTGMASAMTSPTALPQHPFIAAQPDIGKNIDDMAVLGNRLYIGGGDYTANTGPIDIMYYDLDTNEPGVALSAAPTEEVNTFRIFHNNLFAPWVDPTGWGGETNPPNGGMSSDVGGWHHEHTFPAGHVYDYTELGDSRFLAGAIAYGGAGVWQSVANGPWQLVQSAESAGGATGWERYYWAITLRNKVYIQAKHNGGTEAQPAGTMFPMMSWDGARWRKLRASIPGVTAGHEIEVFKDRAYYRGGMFDGTKTMRNDCPLTFVRDWYNAGDYLYAVGNDGTVARTDGNGWDILSGNAIPSDKVARSLAVYSGKVYVGTSDGYVYESTI